MGTIGSVTSASMWGLTSPLPSGKTEKTGVGSTKEFASFLEKPDPALAKVAHGISKAEQVNRKLETMLLSQFISEFMRHDAQVVFGEGVQGDFYTSLFSDAVAEQIAGKGIISFSNVV